MVSSSSLKYKEEKAIREGGGPKHRVIWGGIILQTASTVPPAKAQKIAGTQVLVARQVLFQKIMFSTW